MPSTLIGSTEKLAPDDGYNDLLRKLTIPDIKNILKAHGICEYGLRSQLVIRVEELLLSTAATVGWSCVDIHNPPPQIPPVLPLKASLRKRRFTKYVEKTSPVTYLKVTKKIDTAVNTIFTSLESCGSLPAVGSVLGLNVQVCEAVLDCASVDSCIIKENKTPSRIVWTWNSQPSKSQGRRPKRIGQKTTSTEHEGQWKIHSETASTVESAKVVPTKRQKAAIRDSSPTSDLLLSPAKRTPAHYQHATSAVDERFTGETYSHVDLDSIQLPDEPMKVVEYQANVNRWPAADVYEVEGHIQDGNGNVVEGSCSSSSVVSPRSQPLLPTPPDSQRFESLLPPSRMTLPPPPAPYPLFVAGEQWASAAARQGHGYVLYVSAEHYGRSCHSPPQLYRAAGDNSEYQHCTN